jgi:hypothetical protein
MLNIISEKQTETNRELAVMVAHACNFSYSGGRGWENHRSKPSWQKVSETPITTKKPGVVVCSEKCWHYTTYHNMYVMRKTNILTFHQALVFTYLCSPSVSYIIDIWKVLDGYNCILISKILCFFNSYKKKSYFQLLC